MKKKIIKIVTVISLVCTLVAAMVIPSFAAEIKPLHKVDVIGRKLVSIWGKNDIESSSYLHTSNMDRFNARAGTGGIVFHSPAAFTDKYGSWFGATSHYFYGETTTRFVFEKKLDQGLPTLTFQLKANDNSQDVFLADIGFETMAAADYDFHVTSNGLKGKQALYLEVELAKEYPGYTYGFHTLDFQFKIDKKNPSSSVLLLTMEIALIRNGKTESTISQQYTVSLQGAASAVEAGKEYTLRCYVANLDSRSFETDFELTRYSYECDGALYTQSEYDAHYEEGYQKGLKDKAAELQAEINGYLQTISGLNTDLATKEAEILELRGRITELEEQIAQGGADDGSYDEGYAAGKADAQADAATEIQRLEKRIATLEGEITDLEEAKKGYQELVEEKNAALEEAQKNHEELIAEKDTEIGNLITENESLSNNNEWLGKENTRLEDENDRQGFEITRLNGVIENLEAEIERLMKEGGDVVGSLFEGIFDGISNLIHPFLEIEFVGFRLSTMIAAVLLILLVVFVLKIIV